MPYSGVTDAMKNPKTAKGLEKFSSAARKKWVEVFNSCYRNCQKKDLSTEECERRSFAAAYSVANKVDKKVIKESKFDSLFQQILSEEVENSL